MNRKLCIASCLMAALLLAVVAGAQTVTVTDMAGRSVTTPADPGRIVCIGPGALRLIVYLQAEDRVVGGKDMEILFFSDPKDEKI
jgi:iron complex transport system substrate-binding protein